MATFLFPATQLNIPAITAQQADDTATNPYMFVDAYNTWNDANQPLSYLVLSGVFCILIPDWNTDAIMDFANNWADL